MKEWRPVVGYEETHLVSNHGDIRRLARDCWIKRADRTMGWWQHFEQKDLGQFLRSGYPSVKFLKRVHLVHQIVLEAFRGPRPAGFHACHGDGNKTNNRADNLRWDTPKANNADQVRHGTRIRGESHPMAKISRADVVEIRRRAASGESDRTIADHYQLDRDHVGDIRRRRTWKHVE